MAFNKRVGVFDSGLGGLTVLRSLRSSFPEFDFVYLGDTARLPYGAKSSTTIKNYVAQNLRFMSRQQVDCVIVACNSASSVLDEMNLDPFPLTLGVIDPGARRALQLTLNQKVGVLATHATVRAHAYRRHLLRLNSQLTVLEQPAPLLVPLVEEGWTDDPLTNLILHRYLQPLLREGIDTLILGCTHYPALIPSFERILRGRVQVVESGPAVVEDLRRAFGINHRLGGSEPDPRSTSPERGNLRILLTDINPNFQKMAEYLMGGGSLPEAELVHSAVD